MSGVVEVDIDCDPSRLDLAVIHAFLRDSYWAKDIPRAIVERSVRGSLCFGAYAGAAQVGFARVVTDRATFAYLADVFVLPTHRGRGISKSMMAAIDAHPELQGLRRWMLATRDAHALYAQHGFRRLAAPERFMERHDAAIYSKAGADSQRNRES